MNDPKTQQEPSMEEILASIRRIISEDDAEGEDGATSEAEDAAVAEEVVDVEPEIDEPEPEPEPDDDVLELTKSIDDDTSLEIEADEYDMAPTDDSDLVEVVELTDEVDPEPDPMEDPAAPETDPVAELVPPVDHSLISPPPAGEAASQFAVLAAAVAGERLGQTMGVGARTIEDLVKEVMRPIIKEWLDENLPGLVERLVGREIDRMARRAEDEVDD